MIVSDMPSDTVDLARDVPMQEAIYLDDKRWDDWLALFTDDCEFWVPTWRADGKLAADPRTELSHIYYANRAGLEDRVARIRSGRSPASNPPPRTTHIVGNVWAHGPATRDSVALSSAWSSHVFFPLLRLSQTFFGRSEYQLVKQGSKWLIARKKVILQNDYISTFLDVYCF